MRILYTAEAVSTGDGRSGQVASPDGWIDMKLSPPKQMGGEGMGANPELLFAAGYSACFHSALNLIGRREKIDVDDAVVTAKVSIGPNDKGGYELAVTLIVKVPGLDHAAAKELADKAHQVCPYSNATRGNIEVTLEVVD
jgi:osmotically inducible protein OsmC